MRSLPEGRGQGSAHAHSISFAFHLLPTCGLKSGITLKAGLGHVEGGRCLLAEGAGLYHLDCWVIMEELSAEGLDEEEQLVRRHRKEKKELQGEWNPEVSGPRDGRVARRGILRGFSSPLCWISPK